MMASASVFYGTAYKKREAERTALTNGAAATAPATAIPEPEENNNEETEKSTGAVDAETDSGAMGVVTSADVDVEDEWRGWRSAVDELSGTTYYFNVRLGRSSWDWPPAEGLD